MFTSKCVAQFWLSVFLPLSHLRLQQVKTFLWTNTLVHLSLTYPFRFRHAVPAIRLPPRSKSPLCKQQRVLPAECIIRSLPSSLLSSRSVPAVRWTTPGAPGIALRILAQNIVADPVRLGAFLFAVHTRMARLNNQIQAQPLPQGFTAQEGGPTASHFMFTICPYAPGNQALTLEMAHRVAFSLSQFMASGGGYRLLQYDAFTEGLTPADDVQFASGTIAMVFVAPLHVPAIVAPQAQGFPVELMGGGRG